MTTLSVPAALGRPLQVGDLTLGNELWRLPLEVALLAAVVWIGRLWRLRAA